METMKATLFGAVGSASAGGPEMPMNSAGVAE
jgi:hypothetical protein